MDVPHDTVNLDLDPFSPELVKCAGSLAKRFNAADTLEV